MCSPRSSSWSAGQVEHVAQALAVGLQHDRELAVALGHLQQRLRLQPLLPQRRALARPRAGQQQRAGGVLAEAGAEQRGGRQLAHHQVLDGVGLDHHQVRAGRLVGVGEVDDDPVVRPDGVGLEAELVADARAQRQRPGGVHPAAERREHAQAPVADLVAEALDHHRAVAGQDPRGLLLLAQVGEEVLGGALVQVVLGRQLLGLLVHRIAGEGADRAAQLGGAAHAVAPPERHRAGRAGRRGDDHPVAGDLLDPPGRRAQQEGLAGAGLVDHLLVQLAHAAAVGQVHAVQPAVGDRAGVGHRQLEGALARADGVLHPVPHDARAQLGELLGGVAAVEHVEHLVQQLAAQLGERVGPAHQLVQLGRLPLVAAGGHGHHVLGQHVERVARHHGVLDLAVAHAAGDHRALEQVGAELGEDPALGHLAHAVAGAADALEAGGHRLGRLHLQHQVHRAHVDAQLQRGGGHQAGQVAGLEQVLDHQALLAGQRPVVGAGDLRRHSVLARELVQPHRQALGAAAVVHEDDRRAVLLHQLEQLGVDRRPDRAAGGRSARPRRWSSRSGRRRRTSCPWPPTSGSDDVGAAGLAHVLDRHPDLQVERLAPARVHDAAVAAHADQEPARPPPAGAGWPTARCAAARRRTGAPGARASATGGRRAWSGPPRGSRPRSPPRRRTASPARAR